MMQESLPKGFIIRTGTDVLRVAYYVEDAPLTVVAFNQVLPFSLVFSQARTSGQEIWTDKAPLLEIPQENCSIFPEQGEIALGPIKPSRNKIAGLMGIFYGEGRLLDAGNIFGKIWEEDLPRLVTLGETIWKQGSQTLIFEPMT
jgi:hypothetical protein